MKLFLFSYTQTCHKCFDGNPLVTNKTGYFESRDSFYDFLNSWNRGPHYFYEETPAQRHFNNFVKAYLYSEINYSSDRAWANTDSFYDGIKGFFIDKNSGKPIL